MSGKALARNAALNFIALSFPLALAVLVAPRIIHGLGMERVGILALIWAVLNYFTIMDFGLGRALTHAVSGRLNTERESEIYSAFSWSLLLILAFAIVLTVLGYLFAPLLVIKALTVPVDFRPETLAAFQLLAGALAIVATTSALNGYLAAFERFDLINLVKVPLMAGTLCAPLFAIGHRDPILLSTALMILMRVAAWIALLFICHRATPKRLLIGRTRVSGLKTLLSFGGWISIINVVNPILTYADRWALGIWATLSTVTYYSVPFEVATKLWIIPTAITTALFPAFCRTSTASSSDAARLLYFGTSFTMAMSFIATLLLTLFSRELLSIWLGNVFATKSTLVLQILLIGTFTNSAAYTAASLLQGRGHPQWIAFLLLAELPLFLVALWLFVPRLGAIGAALVWFARVSIDAWALRYLARQSLTAAGRDYPPIGPRFLAFIGILLVSLTITSTTVKLVFCLLGFALFLITIGQLTRRAHDQRANAV